MESKTTVLNSAIITYNLTITKISTPTTVIAAPLRNKGGYPKVVTMYPPLSEAAAQPTPTAALVAPVIMVRHRGVTTSPRPERPT